VRLLSVVPGRASLPRVVCLPLVLLVLGGCRRVMNHTLRFPQQANVCETGPFLSARWVIWPQRFGASSRQELRRRIEASDANDRAFARVQKQPVSFEPMDETQDAGSQTP